MLEPFRFTMSPKDDLSMRTDFSFDLMQKLRAIAKEAIDGAEPLAALRSRADIEVDLKGTLRDVRIDVRVTPHEGVAIGEDELLEARKHTGRILDEVMRERMNDVLQEAIDTARGRM